VVGDREAVGLVAHALQELQLGRVVVEQDRVGAAGDEDLLDPLGQRDDGHAAVDEPSSARMPAPSCPGPPSMTTTFGSVANDSLRLGSCGDRSCWASHCFMRRERTSSMAAKSSGTPSVSPRIVKRR
jgi:hypothetical protein